MIEGAILYVVLLFGKCEVIDHETYGEMVCERDYMRVFFKQEAEAKEWFKAEDWSKYRMVQMIRGETVEVWTGTETWKDGQP